LIKIKPYANIFWNFMGFDGVIWNILGYYYQKVKNFIVKVIDNHSTCFEEKYFKKNDLKK
tara:strand:- start:6268 stop:6447 length:180 start_codon:yes stop_codon:yes gene_type:complete